MSSLFCGCEALISLPDISNWNTSNVKDIHRLFSQCSSIKYLPNISNWNTSNVNNMSEVFADCLSLISFLIYHFGIQVR